ncbi:Ras-specific guanine nucleotide-releasing factor RalGPS1 [Harpegnathos saltator]|uniref:Ras-specific guanine nucleotide-releasing factor RalGPS1 n=2 Tax=Harpegnathos saltator TaxID=610380 RepID=E2BZI1_HARSA|nr:Ras-specific guanine nucleotide-releasing factor RalGPS1 [Harpegnathos saltator]
MNLRITVWDLDSGTLATQLTMIDRDLFVRIPTTEIDVLVHQKSSRNAPNLGAWIAFSHRIACLTVSEILAIRKLDMRTRIMARFINAAEKCFALGNFQSCRSILAGLQAPPIHRLRKSWSYLRTHHASRYESMEKLSKVYKSPRCSRYQRAWAAAERRPPCMPYVGHFLLKVLELNDSRGIQANFASSARKQSTVRIACASPLSVNNNVRSRDEENPTVPKRCLARRFLTTTLTRIRFTTRKNNVNETENNAWTLGQRYLARKFFRRWHIIRLASKARVANEKRSAKNMDSKTQRVLDVAAWLTDRQRSAQTYNFTLHSFAHEFLLKARYREDRENFFISLKLEPPT